MAKKVGEQRPLIVERAVRLTGIPIGAPSRPHWGGRLSVPLELFMALRRFALVLGIVFLIVGIAGFVPGMTVPHEHPDVIVKSGLGLELSLFPINVLHNIVHLLFGVWGLLAARSAAGAHRWRSHPASA